jgi:NitT/TauT family transport system ATP-binding protein
VAVEPREHAQEGRLAAAGRADDADEFAVGDIEREIIDGRHRASGGIVDLADVAGLDSHTSGSILIRPGATPGKPLNSVVFQEYAVFPWKTVIENVAFGLQMRGVGRAERLEKAEYWLERVGLRKFAGYYPYQISGGMKQRVSIIRALANDPEVLLMDEPLGALDAQTRIVLQDELLRIWEETRKTVVYITHSLDEAILLGDRVILMTAHPGRLLSTFHIGIKRPRTIETMNSAEFGALRGAIWDQLGKEVTRAMEMQA